MVVQSARPVRRLVHEGDVIELRSFVYVRKHVVRHSLSAKVEECRLHLSGNDLWAGMMELICKWFSLVPIRNRSRRVAQAEATNYGSSRDCAPAQCIRRHC